MTYQAQISEQHLQIIYRVMLRRISKGYGAERLSFLIGKDYNYIEQVELLLLPVYPVAELERIALALQEKTSNNFYASSHDDKLLNISLERQEYKKQLSHSYSMIDENGEKKQLFKLMEEIFCDFDEVANSNENYEIAIDTIDLLIRAGYFLKAKMPAEIFHTINHFLPIPLGPFYIELAMIHFCEDGQDSGPLKKYESLNNGICYQEYISIITPLLFPHI